MSKTEAIYQDELMMRAVKGQVDKLPEKVQKLADYWNSQGIMGKFTKQDMVNLLDEGVRYFIHAFQESIRRDEAQARGQAYYDLVDVHKYSPRPLPKDVAFNPAKLDRIIENLALVPSRAGLPRPSMFVDLALLEFKDGVAFVPKDIYQRIEDAYSIYATKDNQQLIDAGKKAAEALNELTKLGLLPDAGKPFIWGEDGYAFDVKTLPYGSGKLPKPAKRLSSNWQAPGQPQANTKRVSSMQPVNLSKGAVVVRD